MQVNVIRSDIQTGIAHKHKTSAFTVEKAWINECECTIGETLAPEGQPIAKIKFNNKEALELRKSGRLAGLSISARAKSVEDLDE